MDRVNRIVSHIDGGIKSGNASSFAGNSVSGGKSDDDIVIISAKRTPIGRAKKGSFKDTHPAELLAHALKAVVDDSGIDPALVKDIVIGNVLNPGAFATQARMAGFLAGYPSTTSLHTLNRQCSSGLQAVASVASAISSGFYDIGVAGGVESMSTANMGASVGELSDKVFENDNAKKCLVPMGVTSENVAAAYGVSRAQQDALAERSHAKALAAQKAGHFSEIVPITVSIKDKQGNVQTITVSKDDGPRPGTTQQKLGKLRAVFKKGGVTTAGNSSQVSDGAAAVLLMKRSRARELGLKPVGVFKTFAVAGVPPEVMGIGPAFAIPVALKNANMTLDDIDIFEINEAFASQAVYCVNKLNIPMEKVNPNGGAIALGHPLGCTGARMVGTLLSELHRTGKKTGIVSMCIGTGMGAAGIIQAE